MMRFDLLDRFAKQKKCNLYILPSSLNEVILIPDRGDRTPDFLRSLVKKIIKTIQMKVIFRRISIIIEEGKSN